MNALKEIKDSIVDDFKDAYKVAKESEQYEKERKQQEKEDKERKEVEEQKKKEQLLKKQKRQYWYMLLMDYFQAYLMYISSINYQSLLHGQKIVKVVKNNLYVTYNVSSGIIHNFNTSNFLNTCNNLIYSFRSDICKQLKKIKLDLADLEQHKKIKLLELDILRKRYMYECHKGMDMVVNQHLMIYSDKDIYEHDVTIDYLNKEIENYEYQIALLDKDIQNEKLKIKKLQKFQKIYIEFMDVQFIYKLGSLKISFRTY